jgi:hypothetical protein
VSLSIDPETSEYRISEGVKVSSPEGLRAFATRYPSLKVVRHFLGRLPRVGLRRLGHWVDRRGSQRPSVHRARARGLWRTEVRLPSVQGTTRTNVPSGIAHNTLRVFRISTWFSKRTMKNESRISFNYRPSVRLLGLPELAKCSPSQGLFTASWHTLFYGRNARTYK